MNLNDAQFNHEFTAILAFRRQPASFPHDFGFLCKQVLFHVVIVMLFMNAAGNNGNVASDKFFFRVLKETTGC